MVLPMAMFMGSGATAAYSVANSLRLNASGTQYLTRTPGSAGTDTTKWTISFWAKRGVLGALQYIIECEPSASTHIAWTASDNLEVQINDTGGAGRAITTNAVYRDPTAHYHIVVAYDRSQAVASNKLRLYVNGSEITSFSTDARGSISGSADPGINTAVLHTIGRRSAVPGRYTDGYISEVYIIDGQQLTPSSFGQTNADGVWVPKAYSGTYGTNGFYLKFANSAALGTDSSGNGNTWTVNNITSADQCSDTPTNNYCTLDAVANLVGTLSNANLTIATVTNSRCVFGTQALPSSGQFYFEVEVVSYSSGGGVYIGVANKEWLSAGPANSTWVGVSTYNGSYDDGASTDTTGLTGTNVTSNADIWCIAVDVTNGKIWVGRRRSGSTTWADGVAPTVNGSGASTIALPSGTLFAFLYRGGSNAETYKWNFGQFSFSNGLPTGFKALCTANLTSTAVGTSGSFTGNAAADGPFVWINGDPATLTINGNAVTFGTHADKTAGGFKLRTSSSSYNASGTNNWTATAGTRFKTASLGTPNTAKGNP